MTDKRKRKHNPWFIAGMCIMVTGIILAAVTFALEYYAIIPHSKVQLIIGIAMAFGGFYMLMPWWWPHD